MHDQYRIATDTTQTYYQRAAGGVVQPDDHDDGDEPSNGRGAWFLLVLLILLSGFLLSTHRRSAWPPSDYSTGEFVEIDADENGDVLLYWDDSRERLGSIAVEQGDDGIDAAEQERRGGNKNAH